MLRTTPPSHCSWTKLTPSVLGSRDEAFKSSWRWKVTDIYFSCLRGRKMVWLHSFLYLLILCVNHQEHASLLSGWGVFLTSFPTRGNKLLGGVLS